ncbi:putative uncharacterized protein C7orf78 homolog [Tiliqua scincoides]|uniref:putative uncharacterized protein C7orf78 homolog n=1 Tax=Tiliqua scincoides TaxID=71010 RepID=UPI00346358B3
MFPRIPGSNQYKCTFDSKGLFTTNLELALARDQVHASQQPRSTPKKDSWIKPPPDFSYKLYITSALLSKKSKELKKKKKKTMTTSTVMLLQVIHQEPPPKIITTFPHVGPYEAQLMFVKKGKFKSSKYQDPKPHDYRQYETGIPDFVTSYARDPLNLKFKLQCLSKVHGLHPLKEEKKRVSKERFITYKPQELKWDPKLLLPKEPWPAKSGSFTRHRGHRGAHSAFIERVEETLSKLWQEEANQKQAGSRRKPSSVGQKSPAASSQTDSEMKLIRRQQENKLQKARLPQSPSTGSHEWDDLEQVRFGMHLKPQPLGFLLPGGIVQSVEELRYK